MKFLRFTHRDRSAFGVLAKDGRQVFNLTVELEGNPSDIPDFVAGGERAMAAAKAIWDSNARSGIPIAEITWESPVKPDKNVFCVGRNYREHIIEGNIARGVDPLSFPEAIEFFSKPPTAIIAHDASVSRHAKLTNSLDYEVELGIVVGLGGRDISVETALEYVFGFTIVNDISARDLQRRHGQWFKGKGLDTTCPIGPVIVHRSAISDPNKLNIELFVNGETRQSDNTRDMIFNVQTIVSQLSAGMTLEPGDVIATGTPKGVGFAMKPPRCLNVGDVMVARIEGIGELRNAVVD
ncbi:fumarylacetoacetate hydrolase family protein [Variovorax boronicumulans]|uniref:fumarylacetoacetate hydrolase family protein n=1 Tax=Variovorax boronicumulans TaxID=436515 RepID=UPI00277DA02F|nr:fumarylacetoacetate hydrolase family protein [Variovorax boronicumulans]MDQ0044332.1 2-keto-4-pentenoate hydratase/2-oxohepta-3-ene-1,7-dioic acid hydratase in catechol pathway [Variovorax boronicumulans]